MKKHILLIDWDLSSMKAFIKDIGEMHSDIKCTYAQTCDHALKMLKFLTVDALFIRLDPDISANLEQVRLIKHDDRLMKIPVLVYCRQMQYYTFLARGYGADYCVSRSDDTDKLKQILQKMLFREPVNR